MFGGWLRDSNRGRELNDFYFDRTALAQQFGDAYSRKRHVLVYGLPRQGKRTLVRHCLGDTKSVAIYASAETTFADIFRNYLLTIGCSVTVEQKQRRKLGGKAEIKFPWPLGPEASIGGGVDLENEVTRRSFSADIASPNDVCYLIREIGRTPVLVIYRFDEMKAKQRGALLDFLKITADGHVLQVVLIASSVELPLDYSERIQMSRYLTILHLPPLSHEESDAFVDAALDALGCKRRPQVAALLYDTFSGSLEQTLDACALIGSTPELRAAVERSDSGTRLQEAVFSEIRDRTQDYLLALLGAIADQDWTIQFARRMSHTPLDADETDDNAPSDGAVGEPGVHPALSGDPVYVALQEAIDAVTTERPRLAAPLSSMLTQALRLGKKVLTTEPQPERVRLLAFALAELIADPTAEVAHAYEPVYADESGYLNFARLLCDLLIEADLDQPLILNEELLTHYFSARGMDVVGQSRTKPKVARFARRIRRLQRDLRIDPPLFKVDEERTQIKLWEPQNARIFGDIRPQLKELIERMDDADGD
ncbi:MAG: hypothetical protein PVSMB1_14340 [Gemmatimonadaceae bacterium]